MAKFEFKFTNKGGSTGGVSKEIKFGNGSGTTTNGNYIKRKRRKDLAFSKTNSLESEPVDSKRLNVSSVPLFSSHQHKDIHVGLSFKSKGIVEKMFGLNDVTFSNLSIHPHILANLQKHGFCQLTTVQEKALPPLLEGKSALIRSQTGSGKSLLFVIPIVNILREREPKLQRTDGIQALIIVPTRELAMQIQELFNKINTFQWIVVSHLCGGENRSTEKARLRKGVHILIGTPGRLLDHVMHTTCLKLDQVKWLILDEADYLLEMGFKRDIEKIVAHINTSYNPMAMLHAHHSNSDLTPQRQTVLLSATLNASVKDLATQVIPSQENCLHLDALDDQQDLIPTVEHLVIPDSVRQQFIVTLVKHRLFMLSAIVAQKCQQKSVKMFIFMATGPMVDFHYQLFQRLLVSRNEFRKFLAANNDQDFFSESSDDDDDEAESIIDVSLFKLHGSMDHSERKQVFHGFRNAQKGVLICTDVAARGIDVPEADCIVQYTGPQTDEDYLHRVGRTGRAGHAGHAIIFLTHEEQDYVDRLKDLKVFLHQAKPDKYMDALCELMEEQNAEQAATSLQRYLEQCVQDDRSLRKLALFAYSSWARFYNTYPAKMRRIFNFRNVNLGHYVTSFALKETPSSIAKLIRNQIDGKEQQGPKFNRHLSTHASDEQEIDRKWTHKPKSQPLSLTLSEYSSGLEQYSNKKGK